MAKKDKTPPTPKPKKVATPESKKVIADRKKVLATKLLEKITRATKRELKKLKLDYPEKQINQFVRTIVLPVFRGMNPRDVKVKDIRELVRESVGRNDSEWYNPLFIPQGDITGIMWADLDDYLSIDLKSVVGDKPLRVEVNVGQYGATGVFNIQNYQYEANQVNEIYDGIRELIENDSEPEYNGSVVVRKGRKDDGFADSYILQFTLYVNGEQVPPTATLDESVGIEIPKETLQQRRERLKLVIQRKNELAKLQRKKQKEKGMRQRGRPKTKEAPATEDKSEALTRQQNVISVLANQKELLAEAKQDYKDGIFDKEEYKQARKDIEAQTNLALSKFKRGGEI